MEVGTMYPGAAAGVIILNDKNEIFLLQRSKVTRNDHGLWSLPGGKVEFYEKVEDAIKRETLEECGVQLEQFKHLGYIDHILHEYKQHWIPQIFLAEKWSGEPKNMEPENFSNTQWFALDSVPKESSQVVFDSIKLYKNRLDNERSST